MVTIRHKLTLWITVVCLSLTSLPLYSQAGDATDGSDYTFGECGRIDQDALRGEIEQSALAVLSNESGGIEIEALVARKWTELEVDAVVDAEVARAVNQLANQENYFDRLWSGWSAEKAEEFATIIADDAFGSPAFSAKIDELSAAIAAEIAAEMEADFARAASAAFLCLKAYIGTRYSAQLFAAFETKVSREVQQVEIADAAPVDVSALEVHSKALGGVGLIVVTEVTRRITQKLSQKIAERIAGRVATRVLGRAGSSFIPIAGWVIGLGLIVWDLWEGGKGALPQIQEALTSEEVKAKIRGEIADSIENALPNESAVVALEMAVTMIEEWNGFCNRYQNVCAVAEGNATFQSILSATPLDQLDQLAALVDALVNFAGRAELDAAIQSGQFEALLKLPEAATTLLRDSKSVTTTLAWAELAGDQLPTVIKLDIHRQRTPDDFDPPLLASLIAVDDPAVVNKLLALEPAELGALAFFAGENLGPLAANLSLDELREVLAYLAEPPPTAPTPGPELAGQLANRSVTVRELAEPAPTATEPPPPASPAVTGGESERSLYNNSIVIATGALVVLLLLVGVIILWRRRSAGRDPYQLQDLRKP